MHTPLPRLTPRYRPLVSVVMPMLNAEATLAEALQSVLGQTAAVPWELLLIDDGSEDGSYAVGETFARAHPDRIRLLRHADGGNHGISASRNLAIQHARGSILAMLDADDVWLPEMLRTQLRLLERYPEAGMVYANAERTWDMTLPCDQEQGPLGDNQLPANLPRGVRAGLLPEGCPLPWFLEDEELVPCTCTVLIRMSAVRAVHGFEESFYGLYDDQAFYAKLMLGGRVAASETCVARYRKLASSCCGRAWNDELLQQKARRQFMAWLDGYQSSLKAAHIAAELAASRRDLVPSLVG